MHRNRMSESRPAFVVRDGNSISGQWQGDVSILARTVAEVLTA